MELTIARLCVLGVLCGSLSSVALAELRDTRADSFVATDALGRSLPTSELTGPPRANRFVGIFYFLWADRSENSGPWDITKILANDPDALAKNSTPPWGPMTKFHHWSEPLFGYYVIDDRWVLRKHAQMLTDAGIDVVIFDVTNELTYTQNYTVLLDVYAQMRREGNRTPQVAFLCPFGDPTKVVRKLYDELYSKGLHGDLWFQWKGKPLILADPDKVDAKIRGLFTFRAPQPDYFKGPAKADMWSWLEVFPQHMFKNSAGENEQMSVGIAQNAANGKLAAFSHKGSLGRSYHNRQTDTRPGAVHLGLNFAEQFEHALKHDPQFIFVTGWNEWIAGRWAGFNGVEGNCFVDQFTQEASRDIEPMKGGHTDNYYYQLCGFVRRFKGSRPPEKASPPKHIDIAGDFAQWNGVTPEYLDDIGDTAHRDHPGFNSVTRYTDDSGRNDIVSCKVTYDETNVYFYVRTRAKLSPHTDPNWMTLFLDTDCDARTGWCGYDFAINRQLPSDSQTEIQHTKSGWNWVPCGEARLHFKENQLMLAVPRSSISFPKDRPLRFVFKWADNFVDDDNPLAFTLHGDTAPNSRFNYLFTSGS